MSVFGEAPASKIVLPCRRRAYFAKTGRRGNCQETNPKTAPKVQLKWVSWGSLGAPWADLPSFDRVLEGVCFSPGHFGVSGLREQPETIGDKVQPDPKCYLSGF